MADNVVVTAGTGTTVAADEVVDGTLGTVKVQYVKLMDGTLDGSTKATVGAGGLKVDPTSSVAMNTGVRSATTQRVTVATDDVVPVSGSLTTVSTVTNLSQMGGVAIALNTGVRSTGTQRVTIATDDLVPVNNSQVGGTAVATGSGVMTAGTQRVAMATDSPGVIAVGTAGSPSANVVTMQGVASMTPVLVTPGVSATANGATASRILAAASNNLTSVKASAGQLYTIDVFNVAAYNVFLKIYNKASAPVVASDTPIMTIPIQAGGGYSKTWPMGLPFATGIAYAIVKLQADTDNTNVVAGDLTGNIVWI